MGCRTPKVNAIDASEKFKVQGSGEANQELGLMYGLAQGPGMTVRKIFSLGTDNPLIIADNLVVMPS
jgi:hypothetical protein